MPAALRSRRHASLPDALIPRSDSPREAIEILPAKDLLALVREQWPHHDVRALDGQGGCSFTVLCRVRNNVEDVNGKGGEGRDEVETRPKAGGKREEVEGETALAAEEHLIVQFRPRRFAVPLVLANRAREIFTPLAPWIRECESSSPEVEDLGFPVRDMDLQICEMEFLPGTRLSELLPDSSRGQVLHPGLMQNLRTLLSGLADFHARAWEAGVFGSEERSELRLNGRVGVSLIPRLAQLAKELPTQRLRDVAASALWAVEEDGGMDDLPVVLTHGDLLPSNLLVDPRTWQVRGVVDWAEVEELPFGMSLYGLDHLLGTLAPGMTGFMYCGEAEDLREWFWDRLERRVEGLSDGRVRKAIELARTVGILLWKGFAWDDGRIDRVITTAVEDWRELEYLNAFLRTSTTEDSRAKKRYGLC